MIGLTGSYERVAEVRGLVQLSAAAAAAVSLFPHPDPPPRCHSPTPPTAGGQGVPRVLQQDAGQRGRVPGGPLDHHLPNQPRGQVPHLLRQGEPERWRGAPAGEEPALRPAAAALEGERERLAQSLAVCHPPSHTTLPPLLPHNRTLLRRRWRRTSQSTSTSGRGSTPSGRTARSQGRQRRDGRPGVPPARPCLPRLATVLLLPTVHWSFNASEISRSSQKRCRHAGLGQELTFSRACRCRPPPPTCRRRAASGAPAPP